MHEKIEAELKLKQKSSQKLKQHESSGKKEESARAPMDEEIKNAEVRKPKKPESSMEEGPSNELFSKEKKGAIFCEEKENEIKSLDNHGKKEKERLSANDETVKGRSPNDEPANEKKEDEKQAEKQKKEIDLEKAVERAEVHHLADLASTDFVGHGHEYDVALNKKINIDLQQGATHIYQAVDRAVEGREYINQGKQRIEYSSSAVENNQEDAERGKYSLFEKVDRAILVNLQAETNPHEMYRLGKKKKGGNEWYLTR